MPAPRGKRVQIPRCRATVSENIADVHWESSSIQKSDRRPGKDAAEDGLPLVLTRKPGDRREPYPETPFACKGGHMVRSLVVFLVVLFLLSVPAVFSGQLHIKILDPHSAAVAGAEGAGYRAGEAAPLPGRANPGGG